MLCPSVEGMVVALGAADLRAEEDADGVVDIERLKRFCC
jgi:hypothetical protein